MADPMDERTRRAGPAEGVVAGESGPAEGLAGCLARLPADHRSAALLDLVREETAGLAGTDPLDIDPEMAYRDYGYNSLAAVELTGRLSRATGLELPLTLLFDHPTAAAVAEHLLGLLGFAHPEDDAPEAEAADADGGPDPDDDAIAVVGMACTGSRAKARWTSASTPARRRRSSSAATPSCPSSSASSAPTSGSSRPTSTCSSPTSRTGSS
ncbi:acyl carrier protein [Streptomyces colonosanans]|uniref:acyl carrier protein n=1 Tax=Streptomyces colonosanans TaxID=1428652 RepID=UPI001FEC7256|nr:acyl carrier protein [Streptomyces colonosanans]